MAKPLAANGAVVESRYVARTSTFFDRSSPVFRFLDAVAVIVFGGLLWLLVSIPVVTLLPATAALFSVMNGWVDGPPAVWSTFWSGLRKHLGQGLAFGGLFFASVAVIGVDLVFVLNADGTLVRAAVLAMAVLLALAVTGTLVFLLPVMIVDEGPWKQNLRNAALLAGGFPGTALLGVVILAVAALVAYGVPPLLPALAGVTAFAIMRLATRAFHRIPARRAAGR